MQDNLVGKIEHKVSKMVLDFIYVEDYVDSQEKLITIMLLD